jgi:hypothetical protein
VRKAEKPGFSQATDIASLVEKRTRDFSQKRVLFLRLGQGADGTVAGMLHLCQISHYHRVLAYCHHFVNLYFGELISYAGLWFLFFLDFLDQKEKNGNQWRRTGV